MNDAPLKDKFIRYPFQSEIKRINSTVKFFLTFYHCLVIPMEDVDLKTVGGFMLLAVLARRAITRWMSVRN